MDHLLREPTLVAVPFFVLFIGLELLAPRGNWQARIR